jgi:hypothetical protein
MLLSLIVLIGCTDRPENNQYIRIARENYQNQLEGLEKNFDGSTYHKYLMQQLRNCLAQLDGLEGNRLDHPIPVCAVVKHETLNENERFSLSIDWVEENFEVCGFYLLNQSGKIAEYPNVLCFDSLMKDAHKDIGFRSTWVPVIREATDTSWKNQKERGKPVPAPIHIPDLDFSKGDVRFGLLTKNGRETSVIPVGFLRREEIGEGRESEDAQNPDAPKNESQT